VKRGRGRLGTSAAAEAGAALDSEIAKTLEAIIIVSGANAAYVGTLQEDTSTSNPWATVGGALIAGLECALQRFAGGVSSRPRFRCVHVEPARLSTSRAAEARAALDSEIAKTLEAIIIVAGANAAYVGTLEEDTSTSNPRAAIWAANARH